MAAPVGNQYATKARLWAQAINRALEKRSKSDQLEALDDLAEKLLDLCAAGDLGALKELGDRLDGRPCQQIIATDAEGRTVAIALVSYSDPSPVYAPALPAPDTAGIGRPH